MTTSTDGVKINGKNTLRLEERERDGHHDEDIRNFILKCKSAKQPFDHKMENILLQCVHDSIKHLTISQVN